MPMSQESTEGVVVSVGSHDYKGEIHGLLKVELQDGNPIDLKFIRDISKYSSGDKITLVKNAKGYWDVPKAPRVTTRTAPFRHVGAYQSSSAKDDKIQKMVNKKNSSMSFMAAHRDAAMFAASPKSKDGLEEDYKFWLKFFNKKYGISEGESPVERDDVPDLS